MCYLYISVNILARNCNQIRKIFIKVFTQSNGNTDFWCIYASLALNMPSIRMFKINKEETKVNEDLLRLNYFGVYILMHYTCILLRIPNTKLKRWILKHLSHYTTSTTTYRNDKSISYMHHHRNGLNLINLGGCSRGNRTKSPLVTITCPHVT